jgi:hypothetical protein
MAKVTDSVERTQRAIDAIKRRAGTEQKMEKKSAMIIWIKSESTVGVLFLEGTSNNQTEGSGTSVLILA